MQTHSDPKPEKALPRPMPRKAEHHSNDSTWKPQQVGLTREEFREIVINLIG